MRRIVVTLAAGLLVVLTLAFPTPASAATPGLQVAIVSVSPSVVGGTTSPDVVVRATLTNTGSGDLTGISTRLRRGDLVQTSTALRSNLDPERAQQYAQGPPQTFDGDLTAGASATVTLRVPVSRDPLTGAGLQITQLGVFTLGVVATAATSTGATITSAAHTLLPVTGIPAVATRDPTAPPAPTPRVDTSAPENLTLLWPLAAPAALTPGVTGGGTATVRLQNDNLLAEISPGGRLYTLLQAPLEALNMTPPRPATPSSGTPTPAPATPAHSPLATSFCLALDPDLLVTVNAMTRGYVVDRNSDPADRGTPGTGVTAAQNWIALLRAVAQQTCVMALPFGQTNVDEVAAIADPGIAAQALSGADIIDRLLDVTSVRSLVWPTQNRIGSGGADLVRGNNGVGVLVSAPDLTGADYATTGGATYSLGEGLAAVATDPAVTAALGALGPNPVNPSDLPATMRVNLADQSPGARREAALAAVAYGALVPSVQARVTAVGNTMPPDSIGDLTGRDAVIAPPQTWGPSADDAAALLNLCGDLLRSRLATARSAHDLEAVAARTADRNTRAASLAPLGTPSYDSAVIEHATSVVRASWQLESTVVAPPQQSRLTPRTYLSPLREDVLRAFAATSPNRAQTLVTVDDTLRRLTDSVSLVDPGGGYTLASERSPLLLVARNNLPLTVRTRLTVTTSPDLRVDDIGIVEVPPRGTRQLSVPTHSSGSPKVTVNVGLVSSDGSLPLGRTVVVSVHANAYGKPLFWATIVFGVLLVLLAGRRLWRRFHGQPDPADADRPEPTAAEQRLAEHPERAEPATRPGPDAAAGSRQPETASPEGGARLTSTSQQQGARPPNASPGTEPDPLETDTDPKEPKA